MLAIFFLSAAALFGVALVRRLLKDTFRAVELIASGVVVGWALTTLAVYVLARVQGRLTLTSIALPTVAAGLAGAWLMWSELRRNRDWWKVSLEWSNAGLAILLLIFAPLIFHLLSIRIFAPGPGGIYSGGNALQDTCFHGALATSFAYGENLPPRYVPQPPEALRYPFMPDFQAAALLTSGFSLRTAFLVTGIALAIATIVMFYSLALRLARSWLAATLSAILFLLNGGLGFAYMLRDWRASGRDWLSFWAALPVNYTNHWSAGIHWTNILVDMFVPQRTSLFGLPMGLMIIAIFVIAWERFEPANKETTRTARTSTVRLLIFAGVLAGLLPLFHTHTYIAVGLISIFLFALKPRRDWIAFWVPALLIAAPQLITLASHAATLEGVVRFQPGWMGQSEANYAFYLLRNFGLPIVLAVPAWLAAPPVWRKFYLAFVMLLVFALVVVVSPNLFDNVKLTYYWHAVNSVLVGAWLVKLATMPKARIARATVAAVFTLVSIASGLTAIRRERQERALLFTNEQLESVDFARTQTAPQSLFLTAPNTDQPVLCLAGRRVVRGPMGWLWSHGYDFRSREADIRRIYAGADDAKDLLRFYDVDYVVIGHRERMELKTNSSFFDQHFSAVFQRPSVTIYDARSGNNDTSAVSISAPREMAARLDKDPHAFFQDFPRTSFFAYRALKGSFGRLPRRDEFLRAMSTLGKGLHIGGPGWEQKLESNRRALVRELTSRDEVKNPSDAEFVGALISQTGVPADLQKAVQSLASGQRSRDDLFLELIEDRGFQAREYDTAFVLTHFFAYLRRDPESPPDRDLSGLNYWTTVLKRSGDYRSVSRSFMESGEYKALDIR